MATETIGIDFEKYQSEQDSIGINYDLYLEEQRFPLSRANPVEADAVDMGVIIGLEVIPAILGGVGGGLVGGAGGSALGNYLSQQYRIGRGLQDEVGLGELGAATAFGAVPVGKLANMGTAGRVATRGAQGAALATGELAARTYIDEDRAPTQEEIATTLLFGGVFGGGLGAIEAKYLSDNLVEEATEGMTRLELVNKVKEKVDQAGGAENFEVGRPIINALGPRRLREVPQRGIDVETQPGLPQPRTGSNVVIDITDTTQYAEDLVQRLENKLLLEAEGQVAKVARLKGQEVTKEVAELQNAFDVQLAEQDEIFKGLNSQVNLGVQKIGDTDALNSVKQRQAILDHRLGKGKGAKKERAKLQADLKRILKRNKMDVLDLEDAMRGNQGGADQPTKAMNFTDRPMEQAGPASKAERMADDKLGSNYEKFIKNVKQGMTREYGLLVGAGGAAELAMLTDDEENEMSKAGFSPMLLALLFGSMGGRQFRKYKKTAAFKRANAEAKANPSAVEPDVIKAAKIDQTLDRNPYTPPGKLKEAMLSAQDFVRNSLQPLSRTLKGINEALPAVFRNHEGQIATKTREYMDKVSPFIVSMTKRLKDNPNKQRLFKQYLLNGEYTKISDEILGTNAPQVFYKEMDEMRKSLDDLRDYARQRGGIDVGYIEAYFPRKIKNYNHFRKTLDEEEALGGIRTELDKALDEYAAKNNISSRDAIPTDEAAEVVSKALRTPQAGGMTPGNVKMRTIESVSPKMLDAYADPADALNDYVQRMVQATERRNFLLRKPNTPSNQVGFDGSKDQINADLGMRMEVSEDMVGALADRLRKENKLSQDDIDKLKEVIRGRFNSKTVSPFFQGVKNANYIAVMGNFGSAITQLGDLAYSLHFNGFDNTFKTLFNSKDNFDFVKHFGLSDSSIDAVTSTDGISNVLDKVFTFTQLKRLDQLGKNTTMNASWKKYKAQAQKDAAGLRDELAPVFGIDRAGQMIKKLKESNPASKDLPKSVEELIWYKFLDLNPATLGEMPLYYNTSGNMRIAYMLKSFTLKQFDVFREAGSRDIKKAKLLYSQGKKSDAAKSAVKGVEKILGLAFVFAAANAGTDVIKDLMYGRPIKKNDLLADNALKLLGINRYLAYKAKREGVGKAILESMLPPMTVFDRGGKDLDDLLSGKEYKGNLLQGSPLDIVYWRYLGGLDKTNNSK